MGRQAEAQIDYAGRSGRTVVLLESDGLIFRKPLAAKLARDSLTALRVEGDLLVGEGPEGRFQIELGVPRATSWLKALATAPPTLADKIGVKPGVSVWIWGSLVDPALEGALKGASRAGPEVASLRIVVAGSADDLASAFAETPEVKAPVWIVHGKGRTAAFGETAVRTWMREAGWIDVKVTAVSGLLSALQFKRRP